MIHFEALEAGIHMPIQIYLSICVAAYHTYICRRLSWRSPIQKDCLCQSKHPENNSFAVVFGILGTDVALHIEACSYDFQHLGDFCTDFHPAFHEFSWLDHDLLSSELLRKGYLDTAFGSLFGSGLRCGRSLRKLFLFGRGDSELKKAELVFSCLTVPFFRFWFQKNNC